jgi:hypothetical protein
MHIVLIAGYAGSGKDFAGSLFIEKGYQRFAFADEVKQATCKRHGIPFHLTQTHEGKATVVTSALDGIEATVRWFLINESARAKAVSNNPAYWAELLAEQIKKSAATNVVITDWRYKAEYTHLRAAYPNAAIQRIRITRPGIVVLQDPSEHELDNEQYDMIINNSGSPEYLEKQLWHQGL